MSVTAGSKHDLYRSLPSVDELLGRDRLQTLLLRFPRELVVGEVRDALSRARQAIAEGRWDNSASAGEGASADHLEEHVASWIEALVRPSLHRVINATGVILHTNLGRAPLSQGAIEAISQTAAGYSNLEYDVATGRRGKRDVHAGESLQRLLGQPAIVVNNNAAALLLVLNELARDGEVVVSRGELIEIGDGFRIPDIMARSGARLREVGTTNRTRIEDYRDAIGPETRLLLRVHRSNFKMVGFTARPSLQELVAVAREADLPLMEDLGSGCLYDFSSAGLEDEPPVTASLDEGVDLVTFSGDKLLGGPQAGIIAGGEVWVRRVRRNPLFRALRADKLTYAALGATLRHYLEGDYDSIPTLRMVRLSRESMRNRAEQFIRLPRLAERFRMELSEGQSVLGGGSTPGQTLPTTLIRIHTPGGISAAKLEERLRTGDPPVVARIEDEAVVFDLRTVAVEEEAELAQALLAAAG